MEILLLLAALAVAYYFFKHKSSKLENHHEDLASRGVPLVKRVQITPVAEDQSVTVVDTSLTDSKSAVEPATDQNQPILLSESEPVRQTRNQIPEDSVLRRHYSQQQLASKSVSVKVPQDKLIALTCAPMSKIPQDSVLHRHFVKQLQTSIEVDWHPRPCDSILKRHYDHFIQAQIAERLLEMAS